MDYQTHLALLLLLFAVICNELATALINLKSISKNLPVMMSPKIANKEGPPAQNTITDDDLVNGKCCGCFHVNDFLHS